ncbi:phage FluMu protein Com [Clostridium algifaecis]|uniref:Phage FluMu protein Com n=1 Tax=Clostridium algifaecis TaxID=1472040 RepID=A0ABS4KPI9_9CLOT|nr:hypothetical protein [Clostridium algifaecis]MBP2031957.1 phage FluMu protein Com [Clostridium algifaecis]
MSKICKYCNRPLSEAQYKTVNGIQYKSCPRCSEANGIYHVYHIYPQLFGTTPARATSNHPEGPQSYCVPCRNPSNKPSGGITCNNL